MKNTIAARIADFLKGYPPFSLLNEDQILSVSGEVKVIYLEKGKAVFRQGEKGHDLFYVVNKGAIALEKMNNNEVEAIDKCDEGDIFGLRPLFARENYLINARAEEESIIYGILRPKISKLFEVLCT